ncbi:NADPH-dependent FMN reductase [Pseudomonas sp. FW215-R2]|uniref:NADPH-dependent FMN reductase n=1 Tax=unclassified Pseudomonas TaxID=196821 RepID=UPI000C88ABD0|nr:MULTISPECIES: NADPH-dependent FMN reductase [unclassified Pseudomonas]PMX03099.1 NADPH-dependent FMN reductase [Pseudomonas sp. FW215-R2]PMX11936.1 NADPH-dependent FMN reductase [Pseudomonas sp. FW215-L1]PMX25606.1 NADPH-dependent FMN reductase [Pseudomonas sp. FW215-E1]PNA32608.1 NADPH-dependent FMN reductase [Pseudomonas sp. FW215-R4]
MSTAPYRLLGISGSLRSKSTNTAVLTTLSARLGSRAVMDIFALNELPLYNADLEETILPASVTTLKESISRADGLIICSPEYNYGISGVLKNALDWASRPGFNSPLKNKPVLIMTSSPGILGGVRAQSQLRETLSATLSKIICFPQIVIPSINKKIQDGRFVDEPTIEFILTAVEELITEIDLASN